MVRLSIELPSNTIGRLLNALAQLGGLVEQTWVRTNFSTVEARMPADRSRDLLGQLAALAGGEGNVESIFDGYQPMRGKPIMRSSTSGRSGPS